MIIYTVEEYYGDEYEGSFGLKLVTSDKDEAYHYEYSDFHIIKEWEVELPKEPAR